MPDLTHEGALQLALNTILNNDETLQGLGNGAFFNRADDETPSPYLIFTVPVGLRTRTFGGEAYRMLSFSVLAEWRDKDGVNYIQGDRLVARFCDLLDGGKKVAGVLNKAAVQARFNAILADHGYYLMTCAENTPVPLQEELSGDSKTIESHCMGSNFHAFIREI